MTASDRVVLDSSGWLEYLTDDTNAAAFSAYVERRPPVIMPAIVLYEVYRKLLLTVGSSAAESFYGRALRHPLVKLDDVLALSAARVSAEFQLAMADAIIYATAQYCSAELVTGDAHFRGLPGVTLI